MRKLSLALWLLSLPQLLCSCLAFRSVSAVLPAKPHPFPSLASSASSVADSLSVFDHVIGDNACRRLHELTLESTQRSRDGSFVFHRGTQSSERPPLTPLETAIDDVLVALNDTSSVVEYWSRRDYLNLDAHADVDEDQLRDDGVLRCPRWGHVLYLDISNLRVSQGDDGGGAAGPTVVFPTRQVAWGSVAPRTPPSHSAASYNSLANLEERSALEYTVVAENSWDEEQGQPHGRSEEGFAGGTDVMVVVPARNGRLLRFPGAAYHAVPRPPERYLLEDAELAAVVEAEQEDDDWGEDWGDKVSQEEVRSVLLFNTWSGHGPRGVGPDRAADGVPDGITIEGDDASNDASTSGEDERRRRWREAHGEDYERVRPAPFAQWTAVAATPVIAPDAAVSVPLMGNRARRGYAATEAVLQGPVTTAVFHDSYRVSSVTLERKQE